MQRLQILKSSGMKTFFLQYSGFILPYELWFYLVGIVHQLSPACAVSQLQNN
jgi:hypothetical protein